MRWLQALILLAVLTATATHGGRSVSTPKLHLPPATRASVPTTPAAPPRVETLALAQVPLPRPRTPQTASRGVSRDISPQVWSAAQVEAALRAGCAYYSVEDVEWVVATGLRIAWRESRYDTHARNPASSARGLFQFLDSWGMTEAQRYNGTTSCYRFVRVYAEGGERAIRSHWAETY